MREVGIKLYVIISSFIISFSNTSSTKSKKIIVHKNNNIHFKFFVPHGFFRNKSSFFSHYFRIFARKKRIKGIYGRIIRTEQLSGGQSFLLRFERVAGGSAGIDLWSHSPLPQGQGRAECEL